jgi:hypothetical protein
VEVRTSVLNPVGHGFYNLGCISSSKMEIRNEYRIYLKKERGYLENRRISEDSREIGCEKKRYMELAQATFNDVLS